MREQEGVVLGYFDALMRGIGKESRSGETVDMLNWFHVCFSILSIVKPEARLTISSGQPSTRTDVFLLETTLVV